MFGLKLKEGRTWNDKDQFAQYKMMINETARKLFRIKDINEASLQTESRLWWSVGTDESKNPAYQVVGVIEDFRTGHLSMGDAPLAILYDEGENPTEPLMAKIAEGKRKEAIQFLKELHNEVMGEGSSIIPLSKMKLKSCTMMTRERPASTSPLPDWLSAFPVSDCSDCHCMTFANAIEKLHCVK